MQRVLTGRLLWYRQTLRKPCVRQEDRLLTEVRGYQTWPVFGKANRLDHDSLRQKPLIELKTRC